MEFLVIFELTLITVEEVWPINFVAFKDVGYVSVSKLFESVSLHASHQPMVGITVFQEHGTTRACAESQDQSLTVTLHVGKCSTTTPNWVHASGRAILWAQ